MNTNTGTLHHLDEIADAIPGETFVEVSGDIEAVADVSAAVRQRHDPSLDAAEAKQRAMDELRALNDAERKRGRS